MNQIEFTVTTNIEKLGINELILEKTNFLITWLDGRQKCTHFNLNSKSSSLSKNIEAIELRLKEEAKKDKKIDDKRIENAIQDIEAQIINRRDEIYSLNPPNAEREDKPDNTYKSKFLEEVSKLREHFEKSDDPYKEWQQEVKKKYDNLKMVSNRYFSDSFQLLQFCLSVKCVQNIHSNDLPFVGFILYKASSLKSTIIDSFQKYPLALYVDDLTKSSFLSHYATNKEEQLQHDDLIPKMKNKLPLHLKLHQLSIQMKMIYKKY